jgi:hypothetical protein
MAHGIFDKEQMVDGVCEIDYVTLEVISVWRFHVFPK